MGDDFLHKNKSKVQNKLLSSKVLFLRKSSLKIALSAREFNGRYSLWKDIVNVIIFT